MLVSFLAHSLEDICLVELEFFSYGYGHVGEVTNEANDIRRVGLHVRIAVLAHGVVRALRVAAWHVEEFI